MTRLICAVWYVDVIDELLNVARTCVAAMSFASTVHTDKDRSVAFGDFR